VQIAAIGADPAVIEPADHERRSVCERKTFHRIINPEANTLVGARRSTATRVIHDDYFSC
jgi:hypothetical protein